MSDKDRERVNDVCRRIERTLQRDWGSTGSSLSERLGTTRYVVPPELHKRILYLHGLQEQAISEEGFRLKSPADFEAKCQRVLDELAAARRTAARRLRPWLGDVMRRYRLVVLVAVLALLVAIGGTVYMMLEPGPQLPPVVATSPKPRPAPKPPAPKPAASAPAVQAPAPAASAASAPATVPDPAAAAAPAPVIASATADSRVRIDVPQQVVMTLRRAEVVKGASGADEIAVIVDVQNIGYASLSRITFDVALYDTRTGRPLLLINPATPDAVPWYAFMRQSLRRGQGVEVRLSYAPSSPWSSQQVLDLVNSGRYQLHLKAVSLADGDNRALPM